MEEFDRDNIVRLYFNDLFVRMVNCGIGSCPEIPISVLSDLMEEYKQKIVIEKLGSSTVLYKIPQLDFEVLLIGGNRKLIRAGYMINYDIKGSEPMDLAKSRVLEVVQKVIPSLVFEDREVDQEYLEDTDDDSDTYSILKDSITGFEYPPYCWCGFPSIIKKGMSMLSLDKPHYAWIYCSWLSRYLSISKELYTLYKRVNIEERACLGCGAKMLGGATICPLCKHKFTSCSDCGKEMLISEGKMLGNQFLCEECLKLPRCRGCGYAIRNGNGVLCDRCENIRGILTYHSGLGRRDESDGSRFKVGLEVEKEDENWVHNINTKEVLKQTGWIIERDSSLNMDTGFEMVSPIYPLDLDEIVKRIQPITGLLNAKTSNHCGGHIHISDTQRSPQEILLDIRGYLPLLYGLYPNRAINEYCEAKEVDSYLERGHRQAINITDRTLEFRIFPAVRNIGQMLFRLSLLDYIIKNKETDVIKVGELLLNKDSTLYKILNTRISEKRLERKALAFVDFTNYIDRDALVLTKGKIERVIKIPKVKEDKTKRLEEDVKRLAINYRRNQGFLNRRRPIRTIDYGYFATLVEGYNPMTDGELPF